MKRQELLIVPFSKMTATFNFEKDIDFYYGVM